MSAGFIIGIPEAFGLDVEVLAVVVYAVLLDKVADVPAHPSAGFGVGEVEEERVVFAVFGPIFLIATTPCIEHPLGMLHRPCRTFHHAFGFKPKHKLGAQSVCLVGNRPEAGGKP